MIGAEGRKEMGKLQDGLTTATKKANGKYPLKYSV